MKGNFQARFWSSGGRGDSPTDCRKLSDLQIVWGPALVLGLAISAYIAHMTRSGLLEIIRED